MTAKTTIGIIRGITVLAPKLGPNVPFVPYLWLGVRTGTGRRPLLRSRSWDRGGGGRPGQRSGTAVSTQPGPWRTVRRGPPGPWRTGMRGPPGSWRTGRKGPPDPWGGGKRDPPASIFCPETKFRAALVLKLR